MIAKRTAVWAAIGVGLATASLAPPTAAQQVGTPGAHLNPDNRDEFAARAYGIASDPLYTLTIDNDLLGDRDDRWYTNGVGLRVLFTPDATPSLETESADWLFGRAPRRLEVTFGQQIFSPQDLSQEGPIADDRPYGAYLYLEADIATMKPNRGFFGAEALVQDRVGLQLGVIGREWSLGEWAQGRTNSLNWGESYAVGPNPRGWDNGLDDEPAVNLVASRTYHVYRDLGWMDAELRPHGLVALGTVYTHAEIGFELRIGDDLHYDLSRTHLRSAGVSGGGFYRPPDRHAWALFAGAQGRAVGRNAFLDGNFFTDGPSDDIDIETSPFVADLHAGFSLAGRDWRGSYTYVFRSEEFSEQNEPQGFGTISLGVTF